MKESLESATENLSGEMRRGKSIKLGRGLQKPMYRPITIHRLFVKSIFYSVQRSAL